jgi:hypothetical protein
MIEVSPLKEVGLNPFPANLFVRWPWLHRESDRLANGLAIVGMTLSAFASDASPKESGVVPIYIASLV